LILIFEKREGRGAELRKNYTLLALQNRDPSPFFFFFFFEWIWISLK